MITLWGELRRPFTDCEARIYPKALFSSITLSPGFVIHVGTNDRQEIIELLKDFAQAMIGAVETAKEY